MTPSTPPPDPATTLAGRIAAGLGRLALVLRHEAWRSGGEHGLSPTQAQVLAELAASPRPLGLRAVADRLAVTMATASTAVSTLVEKGLVEKGRAEHDARAIELDLTRAGRDAATSAAAPPAPVVDACSALPASDQVALLRGLVGLVRELQDRGFVPAARMCVGCRFFRPHAHPGEARPHHCTYVDAPIGDADLRLDCREMEPVPDDRRARLWQVYLEGRPLDDAHAD